MATPSGLPSQDVVHAWQAITTENPVDNVFLEYSELARYEEGKAFYKRTGGSSLIGTVEYAENPTVASMSPTTALNTTIADTFDQWEGQWKQYGGTFTMTTFERATNRGAERKFELERAKVKNLRSSFRKKINEHIFGNTAVATDISGYQTLIPDAPATGIVEGINAGTYSWWRSKQVVGTSTANPYDNLRAKMREIRGLCSKGQGVKFPTRYVTTEPIARGYEGLLLANERIVDEKTDAKANGAFSGNTYYLGDAKVFWDFACPAAHMYALNEEDIQLAYQSGFWMHGYAAVDPADKLLDVFKVETQCQLIVKARRHLGVITAIS